MYDFKRIEELAWAGLVAVVVTLLQVAIEFDPDKIARWETWAIGVGAGIVRAFAAAVLAQMRPQ